MILRVGMRLEFEFETPAVFAITANLFGHMGFGGNPSTPNSFVRGVYARYEGNGDFKAYVGNIDTGNVGTLIATLLTSTWYQVAVEVTATGGDFWLYDSTGALINHVSVTHAIPTTASATGPVISAGRSGTDAALASYAAMTVDYAAFVMPDLGRRINIGG
jgi:hypothetical protein